ncbi:MAG TPA: putative zinc-binding metallopeptidase [Gemmatimonadales bacterium]|nr:putative zinc-binding metallopeptidase [Gemmatimonadales bacterium]
MRATHKRRRPAVPKPELRCACGYELRRYWRFCPSCARRQVWPDTGRETGAECYRCGWVVSDRFSYCPWCGARIYEKGYSSESPLKAPKGFTFHARCDWGCGGGVEYPMPYCPWCGREQTWSEDDEFEGDCPHCGRGVDDWMNACPWCGGDATGQDLIPEALTRVRRLLLVSRIRPWGYRVLLRPGVSGVDPRFPKIVEIDQDYVVGKRKRDEIPWPMLVGLLAHELGHSYLYHNWRWTRTERFRRVFGEVDKAYRGVDDTWVDFQRRRVATTLVDHVSAYAATHPQEDFAETFRFYVTRRGRMRELFAELGRKRKGLVTYEKFLALHDYARGRWSST